MQIRHSSDVGACQTGFLNSFCTQFFGGINIQAVHHLFPSVNSVYLSELVPIGKKSKTKQNEEFISLVKQTCDEFKIPYTSHENIFSALFSVGLTFAHTMREEGEVEEWKKE